MKRRLLNMLSAMLVLLMLGYAVLWVRGFWGSDYFALNRWNIAADRLTGWHLGIRADSSQFSLDCWESEQPMTAELQQRLRRDPPSMLSHSYGGARSFHLWVPVDGRLPWEWIGFTYGTWRYQDPSFGNERHHELGVPFWFVFLVLLAMPLWRLRLWRLQRRRRQLAMSGRCLQCGYDLRGSKDRCPECGTPIPAQTVSSGGKA